jgi:hypothetical protein
MPEFRSSSFERGCSANGLKSYSMDVIR